MNSFKEVGGEEETNVLNHSFLYSVRSVLSDINPTVLSDL